MIGVPLLITVVILDSVIDPHNVGAIIRSADQFGASLVLLPERNSANKVNDNDVILRTSAGAAAWVPVSVVPNLVRCVEKLKDNGFWVYGADAGGTYRTGKRRPHDWYYLPRGRIKAADRSHTKRDKDGDGKPDQLEGLKQKRFIAIEMEEIYENRNGI